MRTHTFSKPVEHGGRTYKTLTFREPTVGDLMVADAFAGEMSKSIAILASISDTPLPVFQKFPAKELASIIAAAGDLLGTVAGDPAIDEALAEAGI